MTLTRIIGFTAIALVTTLGYVHGQEPALAAVVAGAGEYAATFQRRLSNIVAEERYVQDVTRINLAPGRYASVPHRELQSDILLVQPAGADRYVEFRDVFEVDGTPVRDRQDRLTALFLNPTSSTDAQIQRINEESARYNIGNIARTINTPTLPLMFLLPRNQARFRFTRGAKTTPAIGRSVGAARGVPQASFVAPAHAWVIDYEETQRPTLIRNTQGADLPAHGRFWIDAASGRVLMSELITDDPIVRATIDVSYQWDARAELMVPAEMRERYEGRRDGAVIEGNATYGKVRQFQVQANERLASTAPSAVERAEPAATDRPGSSVSVGPPTDAAAADAAPPTLAGTPARAPEPQDGPTKIAPYDPTKVDPQDSMKVDPSDPPKVGAGDSQPPTFHAGTELVLVDFVVHDKADRPVQGLSAGDFVVKEDGRERPIVTFEAFTNGGAPRLIAGGALHESPARSTPQPPNASTVVLVDDGQLSPQQAARLRPALKALLATVAEPSGVLHLVAPGSRISVAGALPGSADTIAAAADRIAGQRIDEPSNFPMSDDEALAIARGELPPRARVAARFATINPELNAEQADLFARELANKVAHDARARRDVLYDASLLCLDWLANRPGRHSLVIVSAGFAQDPDDAKYYEVITRSLRANAPIHFLDARGLQGISTYKGAESTAMLSRNADEGAFGAWQAAAGSMALADETGGLSISNSNDMAKGLGRVLDTMTTYYVLAYQPVAHGKPGYRKITVEVRVKGLQVRARRGYVGAAK